MTSVLITAAFLILVVSGIILFVSPPGRIANWTNWSLLALTKKEWTALHIWFSALFLAGAVLHVIFNWRPLMGYFKDRLRGTLGFRWEWAVALALCGLVFAGTRLEVAPFSTLLAFNERVKESWDQPRERAPIPHAELLTLAELSQKAGVELAAASNRLAASGITGIAADVVVQQLADQNHRSAQQIYQIMLAETGGGGGGKGHGGGGGGGVGWKTLAAFCAEEGLSLPDAQARLQAKGINADAQLTLREIALNHGYTRPVELLQIIRGK